MTPQEWERQVYAWARDRQVRLLRGETDDNYETIAAELWELAGIGETQRLICRALEGQSLSDHLGDVRSSERHLWEALGVSWDEVRAIGDYLSFEDESPTSRSRPARSSA